MTYQEFFRLLGNPDPICLIDNKIKISVNEINKYNKKYDIYFIPNIGGTKSKDITDFKAFFVDLDCGRDENMEMEMSRYVQSKNPLNLKYTQYRICFSE